MYGALIFVASCIDGAAGCLELVGRAVAGWWRPPTCIHKNAAIQLSMLLTVLNNTLAYPLTGAADLILVNSNFTAGVFGDTFSRLSRQGVQPAVLYPAVAIPPETELQEAGKVWKKELSDEIVQFIGDKPMFLSINRCVLVMVKLVQCKLTSCM
jgi:hypothetical protein